MRGSNILKRLAYMAIFAIISSAIFIFVVPVIMGYVYENKDVIVPGIVGGAQNTLTGVHSALDESGTLDAVSSGIDTVRETGEQTFEMGRDLAVESNQSVPTIATTTTTSEEDENVAAGSGIIIATKTEPKADKVVPTQRSPNYAVATTGTITKITTDGQLEIDNAKFVRLNVQIVHVGNTLSYIRAACPVGTVAVFESGAVWCGGYNSAVGLNATMEDRLRSTGFAR